MKNNFNSILRNLIFDCDFFLNLRLENFPIVNTSRFILHAYALQHNLEICTDAFDAFHMNFPYQVEKDRVLMVRDKLYSKL